MSNRMAGRDVHLAGKQVDNTPGNQGWKGERFTIERFVLAMRNYFTLIIHTATLTKIITRWGDRRGLEGQANLRPIQALVLPWDTKFIRKLPS